MVLVLYGALKKTPCIRYLRFQILSRLRLSSGGWHTVTSGRGEQQGGDGEMVGRGIETIRDSLRVYMRNGAQYRGEQDLPGKAIAAMGSE